MRQNFPPYKTFLQQIVMQQKTADTLAHASEGVVSLAAFLKKARDKVGQILREYEEKRAIESGCSDGFKVQNVNLSRHIYKVEDLLRVSNLKEIPAATKGNELESQRRKDVGHLGTSGFKGSGFQTRVAQKIEDGFMEFYGGLVRLLSSVIAARRYRIIDSVPEMMVLC